MDYTKPIVYDVKHRDRKVLLKLVLVDDTGLKMQSPYADKIKGLQIGEILVDAKGNHFRAKKMNMEHDTVWMELVSA